MAKSKLRLLLAVLVLAVSIALLVWGLIPPLRMEQSMPIPPDDLQLPTLISSAPGSPPSPALAAQAAGLTQTAIPSLVFAGSLTPTSGSLAAAVLTPTAIPESRHLTLEWPSAMRVGDAGIVRLTLEVDAGGNLTAAVETGGQQAHGGVIQLPDVYDTHNVVAEARLDMAGVQVKPPETVSEPLSAGRSVTFYWSVRPSRAGVYRGTVWFYLHFIPRQGGVESRQAVSAQRIEIRAVTLLGLAAAPARMIGGLGSLISAILGFPFVEDIVRWMCYKRKA